MSEFAAGGIIEGGRVATAALDPAECVVRRDGQCARGDVAHQRLAHPTHEWIEAPRRLCDATPALIRGACLHARTVTVESVVTGEALAHLCLTCDAQLPEGWGP